MKNDDENEVSSILFVTEYSLGKNLSIFSQKHQQEVDRKRRLTDIQLSHQLVKTERNNMNISN